MELLQYWKVIQRNLWIILLTLAIVLGGTASYTLSQPTRYESRATLLLNPAVPNPLVPYIQSDLAANLAESYTQLIHTRSFAESVVKQLPFSMAPDDLTEAITTRLAGNTLFYTITGEADHPDQAQQLVSTVLKVFLSVKNAERQAGTNTDGGDVRSEARQRMDTQLQYLEDQIKSYEAEIKTLQAQPATPARDDQLLQLRGQLVSLQQTETQTLLAVVQLGENTSAVDSALVIDQPTPGREVSSKLPTNLFLAGLAGLLLGLGLAFLRNYLDSTIRSPEHLEELLGVEPMAILAEPTGAAKRQLTPRRRAAARAGRASLVTLGSPLSATAEHFKMLSTNIHFATMENPIRSLVVTSAGPQEGKSFTAANLAITMAQAGNRVILVDADLRQPSLHQVFNLPNVIGFSDLVYGKATQVPDTLQAVAGVPTLAVVTSGPLPPNPYALVNSPQAAKVMAQLAEAADLVIYDSSPAGAVSDPLILASRTDAVLLVIGAGMARRALVARVIQNLRHVGATVVVPVLNRAKKQDTPPYWEYTARRNGAPPPANGYHPESEDRAAPVGREPAHPA
jgi:capsular exopolysaccharide synthesis family protein